jgi:hypothetical protein
VSFQALWVLIQAQLVFIQNAVLHPSCVLGAFGVIAGTFGVVAGTFGVISGTLGVISNTLGVISGIFS